MITYNPISIHLTADVTSTQHHSSNLTVTTCSDGITEPTEDEGLGINIYCSSNEYFDVSFIIFCSASALCQVGNNNGKCLNFPVVPLSERNSAGRTGHESNTATLWSSKKRARNKTKRKMEY